jgi:repressor LexA
MLTRRQADVLKMIETGIALTGSPPSYRQMAAALGLLSTSGVFKLIEALEERGFIKKIGPRGAANSIKVLRPQTHLNPEYLRGYQEGYEAGYEAGNAGGRVSASSRAR